MYYKNLLFMQSCEKIHTPAFYMPIIGKILRQIRNISHTRIIYLDHFIQ